MKTLREQLRRFKLIIIILLIVIIVLGFMFYQSTTAVRTLPEGATERAQVRDVEDKVSVEGNITGRETRQIFFSSGSTVKDVKVSLNQRVSKDQALVTISSRGLTGETETEIKSPISGFVSVINFNDGDVVSNPSLFGIEIIDDSSVQIEVAINENDIYKIKKDQSVTLQIPAISLEDEFSGKVTVVSNAPLSLTGAINYKVIIVPSELPTEVRIGMSVDAEILTQKVENVLSIPESFIIDRDEKYFVKKVVVSEDQRDYKLEEVEVTIGLRTDEFVEIKDGIEEGTELIEPSFTVERGFGFF